MLTTSLRKWSIRIHSSNPLFRSKLSLNGRFYSTPPVLPGSTHEIDVKVNIGLDQQMNLAIRQPPKPETSPPIIIYLHSGLPRALFPPPSTIDLAISANATIVRLDYRLSKGEPYPFPIHSVLAGYDWVLRNLLPPRYTPTSSGGVIQQDIPQIGVCGDIIGGSLATMLALTECHKDKRGAIKAAAVGNPIVDWTALVEDVDSDLLCGAPLAQKATSKKKKASQNKTLGGSNNISPPSLTALRALRSESFRKPENNYDPFASPLLFFRTPRYALPGVSTTESVETEYPLFPDEIAVEPELVKVRMSHRAYPPTGSGLVLPRLRLEVGEGSVVRDQGLELVELWRRSVGKREEGNVDVKRDATEVIERSGAGVWGEKEMGEVGEWFGKILRGKGSYRCK